MIVRRPPGERGVMLLMALGLLGLLWFVVLGFASSSIQSLSLASAALASERATNAAEAGLLVTLRKLEKEPTFRPTGGFETLRKTRDKYRVRILEGSSAPVKLPENTLYLLSVGQDRTGREREVAAVVQLGKPKQSLLSTSVFASTIDIDGGSSVDSFDSRVGPYSLGEEARVATNSESPGSIRMGAGTYIKGSIQVGPNGVVGPPRPDRPTMNSANTVWKNWSAWSKEESNLDQRLDYPPVDAPRPGKEDVKVNWKGVELEPGAYGELKASGGGNVQLDGGTYVFTSVKLTGGARLSLNGSKPTTIYVTESLDLSGGTIYNTSQKPRNLLFMMDKGAEAKLTGGAQAFMVVYGPEAKIKMAGGTNLFGALVAGEVDMKGGARVHYDIDLAENPPAVLSGGGGSPSGDGVTVLSWQRL